MIDMLALKSIRHGDEEALAKLIDKYGAYVGTIARRILGGAAEDAEEVASDVFLALWNNPERPNALKLKAYLGGIARNKAKNKLRERLDELPLEEDYIVSAADSPEDTVIAQGERLAVRSAVRAMKEPDREIFLRHYYGLQTVRAIADEMKMNESAIKHRLSRGREKLKTILTEEVNSREEKNIRPYGLR